MWHMTSHHSIVELKLTINRFSNTHQLDCDESHAKQNGIKKVE